MEVVVKNVLALCRFAAMRIMEHLKAGNDQGLPNLLQREHAV